MNLNSVCVADIETDGLNPTKIHCLSIDSPSRSTTSYQDMRKLCSREGKLVVMHNGRGFDKPVLERLLGCPVKFYVIDTLFLSWYLYPDRANHGLEQWGEELGVKKPEIEDWDNLTEEEYIHRCQEDVKINRLLWDKMLSHLRVLYGTDEEVWRLIDYLMFKAQCAADQAELKWKLDVEACQKGLERLQEEEREKLIILAKVMPKAPVWGTMQRPKAMYLKTQVGVLSASGERWHERCKEAGVDPDKADKVKYATKYEDPNPGSITQLKNWFESLGWEPDEYKYLRDKDTNEVRKIPQINKQAPGEVGLCESVKLLYSKCPDIEHLDGLFVIRHRQGILRGFLEDCDEGGYVRARITGLTNTLRFKHKVVLNLPGIDKPYGTVVRGALICEKDELLCGSDMSGLEDRTGNHYMSEYDPDYVEEKSQPGYDAHLKMCQIAGLLTEAEVNFYKNFQEGQDKAEYKRIKSMRHIGKQANYACVYGAGPPRIALTAGIPERQAKKLWEAYWKINWSVKAVADAQTVKTVNGQMWLLNPVSKLWYSLRHKKDIFSTLNQGTGVWCFDTWLRHIKSRGLPVIGQMHDEFIGRIKEVNKERCQELVEWAIEETNKELNLNVLLACSIDFGKSYAEIH